MGKRQTIDGRLYYSPNALIDTPLDLAVSPSQNPFLAHQQMGPRITYQDLRNPRWWSMPFGWTSFIPSKPWSRGGTNCTLGELATRPLVQEYTDESGTIRGYGIASSCQWYRLERDIYTAVVTLKNKFHIPCVLPALPHVYGYTKIYASRSLLLSKITHSREWFFVWLGALGYLIAWAHQPSDSAVRIDAMYPEWRTALEAAGLTSSWIDDVLNSPICRYRPANQRVGCILNLIEPIPGQPTVQWLVAHGIPVWYRWGDEEDSRAREDDVFKALSPPHEDQDVAQQPVAGRVNGTTDHDVTDMESTNDSTADEVGAVSRGIEGVCPQPTQDGTTPGQDDPHDSGYTPRMPEWVVFFEERGKRNEATLAKEKAGDRLSRENRQRQPPTSSAKVFVWERSENPSTLYERAPVLAKWRSDTLESYGVAQKRYDPISNEWDCCDDFGQPDEELDDESETQPETGEALPDDTAAQLTVAGVDPMSMVPQGLVELDCRMSEVRQDRDDRLAFAMQDHFHIHYGFNYPVPDAQTNTHITPQSQKLVLQMADISLEIVKDREDYLQSNLFAAIHAFFHAIAGHHDPPATAWDITESCPQPVGLSDRFQSIKVTPISSHGAVNVKECHTRGVHSYYLLTPKQPSERWTFATLSASTALLACRLPRDYTESDIAYYFAQRALPFRIFYPSKSLVPRHPHLPIQHVIPIRPHNHTFTLSDYDAYVRTRTMLLGQSHMQAALKRGGIAWRLAIGTLGLNAILQPPTLYNEFQETVISGDVSVEDVLTEAELDLLCGAYECFSANKKDRALKSWWPLVRFFEKEECAYNHGYWTDANEKWYEQRLWDIEAGTATPLTYTEWKSKMRGSKAIRDFLANVEKQSCRLLRG